MDTADVHQQRKMSKTSEGFHRPSKAKNIDCLENSKPKRTYSLVRSHGSGKAFRLVETVQDRENPQNANVLEQDQLGEYFIDSVNIRPFSEATTAVNSPSPGPGPEDIGVIEPPDTRVYRIQPNHQDPNEGWSGIDLDTDNFVSDILPSWPTKHSSERYATRNVKNDTIRARIRKSSKGFILRLLRRLNSGGDEIADISMAGTLDNRRWVTEWLENPPVQWAPSVSNSYVISHGSETLVDENIQEISGAQVFEMMDTSRPLELDGAVYGRLFLEPNVSTINKHTSRGSGQSLSHTRSYATSEAHSKYSPEETEDNVMESPHALTARPTGMDHIPEQNITTEECHLRDSLSHSSICYKCYSRGEPQVESQETGEPVRKRLSPAATKMDHSTEQKLTTEEFQLDTKDCIPNLSSNHAILTPLQFMDPLAIRTKPLSRQFSFASSESSSMLGPAPPNTDPSNLLRTYRHGKGRKNDKISTESEHVLRIDELHVSPADESLRVESPSVIVGVEEALLSGMTRRAIDENSDSCGIARIVMPDMLPNEDIDIRDVVTPDKYSSPQFEIAASTMDLEITNDHYSQELEAVNAPSTKNRLAYFSILIMESMLQAVLGSVPLIFRNRDRHNTIPKDHIRIRWICKCGKALFDDFVEKRPGAARLLEEHLNRPRVHAGGQSSDGSAVSPSSSASQRSSAGHDSSASRSTAATSTGTDARTASNEHGREARYTPKINVTAPPSLVSSSPLLEQLWVLACAERQKFTTKLVHLDAGSQKIKSDMDLARLLKREYAQLRPGWKQFLRLRGLNTIQFVQFELHRSQVVDIRKCPDLPDKADFTYQYLPTDLIPPVGERYLMHLFHHPEDYEDETITYNRIPKKRGVKLRVGENEDVGVGWGIHLVEAFLPHKVWSFFTALFVIISLVFSITWAVKRGDVQGAFGVAAYVCTLATLIIGCCMAYLE